MKNFKEYKILEAIKKNVSKGGDCYSENAKQFQLMSHKNKKLKLVHGYVISQTINRVKYDHCWFEDDELVYDYSNGHEFEIPKIVYYALGNIKEEECFKYSDFELNKKLLKYEHWGPWDLKPKNEKIK